MPTATTPRCNHQGTHGRSGLGQRRERPIRRTDRNSSWNIDVPLPRVCVIGNHGHAFDSSIARSRSAVTVARVMRWVFRVTPGYVGPIHSETRIGFWPDEPGDHGFDPSLLITVDLARTPSAALRGEISHDAVEVDDCFS